MSRISGFLPLGAFELRIYLSRVVNFLRLQLYCGKDLRELEWWRAPELEMQFCLSTFVNIHNRGFASADSDARHFVDGFCDVLVRFTPATSCVAHGVYGENARPFRDTTEIRSSRCSLPLSVVESVEDIKRRMAG